MSEATSPPDAEHVTNMLNRREDDIEALLTEAAKNVDTSDAISEIASFDQSPQGGERVIYGPPVNAMAPEELRGTRFLPRCCGLFCWPCVPLRWYSWCHPLIAYPASCTQIAKQLRPQAMITARPSPRQRYAELR